MDVLKAPTLGAPAREIVSALPDLICLSIQGYTKDKRLLWYHEIHDFSQAHKAPLLPLLEGGSIAGYSYAVNPRRLTLDVEYEDGYGAPAPARGRPLYGRKDPYTERGIRRVPCTRCGRPAKYTWNICADGNLYRPICEECDIALNETVLRFMGFPEDVVQNKIKAYKRQKEGS